MSGKEIMFTPVNLGAIQLKNRLVMAPLTRMRAVAGHVPNPLAKTYYAQRASAGLIITEATQISTLGMGYPATQESIRPSKLQGGKKLLMQCMPRAGLSLRSYGMLGAFPILHYTQSMELQKLLPQLLQQDKRMALIGNCMITKHQRQ